MLGMRPSAGAAPVSGLPGADPNTPDWYQVQSGSFEGNGWKSKPLLRSSVGSVSQPGKLVGVAVSALPSTRVSAAAGPVASSAARGGGGAGGRGGGGGGGGRRRKTGGRPGT